MNKLESLLISLQELKANKLRSLLTMLGIIFGVGSVISMMSIGEGARRETLEQIELLGTNNILIKAKSAVTAKNLKASFSPGLNLRDAISIKDLNPFVESITVHRELLKNIYSNSIRLETNVVGTTPSYKVLFNSDIKEGTFLKDFHVDNTSNVCVLGYGIKEKLFKFTNAVGQQIKIDDIWFNVVGVLSSKQTKSFVNNDFGIKNFDDEIYVPMTSLIYRLSVPSFNQRVISPLGNFNQSTQNVFSPSFSERFSINQITAKVKKSASIYVAVELIKKVLERRHYGVGDYEIIVPEELLEKKQKTQNIFNIVMGAIAGISLLVGGIGIMNIMLANILERTKEIGIRRAMGATKKDILHQFLFEALLISGSGGLFGILTGYFLTSVISEYAGWRTAITPFSVILAFLVSIGVGLLFGILPAKRAAGNDPIESLRYE